MLLGSGGKRGPGRPKGSGRRKRKRGLLCPELILNKDDLRSSENVLKVPPFYALSGSHQKTVVNMVENNDDIPRLPGMLMPSKRGPGRPKKTPPTLEPILPIGDKSPFKGKKTFGSNQSGKSKDRSDDRTSNVRVESNNTKSSGSMLHDICERVSKRLDIPLPTARLPKPWVDHSIRSGPSNIKEFKNNSEPVKLQRHKLGASLEKRKNGRRKLLASRTLSLSKGLMRVRQHKHKKRKKIKQKILSADPRFLNELERLALDFAKLCRINVEGSASKTSDSPPMLPSIFRVKRIVKKRKGSERSKTSDRDSGPEVEVTGKDKTPTHTTVSVTVPVANVKRRPKKKEVETPKVLCFFILGLNYNLIFSFII